MTKIQRILVFQQNGSGESKIKGISEFGAEHIQIQRYNIDQVLPPFIDDGSEYLPQTINADLVLDFLTHPDLSHDLAAICQRQNIPVVASGKKLQERLVFSPPT